MKKNLLNFAVFLLCFISVSLLCSCQEQKTQISAEVPSELLGTWVLAARIINGQDAPAQDRVVTIVFKKNGVFETSYKGEPDQEWVRAGQGAYSYNPPILSLHWDSGRVVPLLLSNLTPESFRAHHGRGLAPLKDQEPDEIFKKAQKEKGPTRSGS